MARQSYPSSNQWYQSDVNERTKGWLPRFWGCPIFTRLLRIVTKTRSCFSNELTLEERSAFLLDMSIVGDSLLASTSAIRINYDILGNTDQFLHAHIFPRYAWESDARRKMPVWLYDASNWSNPETAYHEHRHRALRQQILATLNQHY